MSVHHLIIIATVLFCFPKNSFGKSIEEALQSTLENNLEIKLEKSRLEQVRATSGDAWSEFLPDISATMQKGRQKNDALKIDRPGDLDKMNDQNVKQLNFTQPIFSGFSSYNNFKEIKYSISSAESFYLSKESEILLAAIESYLNLYRAVRFVDIKEEDEGNSRKLLKLLKVRNKSGDVGGAQVIRYQSYLASARAEKLMAQRELLKAEEEYQKNTGLNSIDSEIPEIDESLIADERQDVIDQVLVNNEYLRSYKFRVKAAKSAVNKSRGAFSPKVEISASLSEQENITYLDNRDLRSESLFLNVKVPIFQRGAEYSGLTKANSNLTFAKQEYESNKENIIRDASQTFQEFKFLKKLINNQAELIELTKNRISKIEQQINVGDGDRVDLIQSKLELNKIIAQQLDSRVNYILSYYRLLMLTGNFNFKNDI